MTQEAVRHRRLSAILAADVVEYSRLMEADEAGTFAALNACRHHLIEPAAVRHRGRIFKVMGDGFLIEFGSVVDAVQCAVDLQIGTEHSNAALLLPDMQKMRLRIGINLGDVIVEHDDLLGDGVNLAVRLQAMSEPGAILLSGTVYDHLKGKIALGLEFLGQRHVKHIVEPVRVYRVLLNRKGAGKIPAQPGSHTEAWRWSVLAVVLLAVTMAGIYAVRLISIERDTAAILPPDKPSVAVLPFANMGGDPEQSYFADGITESLITDLSQVSGLFVISPNSVFVYKDKNVPLRQVAEELGVRYLLEGSVQHIGDKLRINAQLVDIQSGGNVWADRYDGSPSDIFPLQDRVTHSIVDALAVRLKGEEQQSIDRQETRIPEAYDAFLRGWAHFRQATPDDYAAAASDFRQAIRLDPDYGRAHAALALVYHWKGSTAWHRGIQDFTTETFSAIDQNMREAEKRPTSTSHQVAGLLATGYHVYPEAIDEFNAAIARDPSDSWSYAYMARALTFAGRPAEALQYIKAAMRLDPHYPPIFLAFQGFAQFTLEQYQQAAASLEQATNLNPGDSAGLLLLGATYGYLGRKDEAKAAIAAFNALENRSGRVAITATYAWNTWDYIKRADRDRLFDGLIFAGVAERMPVKPK